MSAARNASPASDPRGGSCDFDPSADAGEFRRCLSQFATGVTVITAVSGGRAVGMTANSFSSLSLSPPLVLWSIAKSSSRFPVFDEATSFAVNVLSHGQTSASRRFASSGQDGFADTAWRAGVNGAPLIDGALAFFECERAGHHDGGDHRILVGQVSRAGRSEGVPLLFSQGAYRVPTDHPEDRADPGRTDEPSAETAPEGAILSDLLRASHKLAAAFVRYRGETVTRDEHRVLISVERRPGLPASEVAEYSFLGAHAAQDALNGLLAKGLLSGAPDGSLNLTEAGRGRRAALVRHLASLEEKVVAGIPAETVVAGRELLRRLAED